MLKTKIDKFYNNIKFYFIINLCGLHISVPNNSLTNDGIFADSDC